jgi:hypothetical protein
MRLETGPETGPEAGTGIRIETGNEVRDRCRGRDMNRDR